MILTTLGSGLNALFTLRAPSISITSVVAQLVAYPMGVGWSWVMPNKQFNTFGVKWNLNPGPFNFKEHTLIVIMANASFGGGAGYFTDTIMAQQGFYGQDFGWGFGILLALSTQCTGFGIAGLMRRWLVEPAAMIWPSNLVSCAFMYALHDHSKTDPAKANGWKIGRYRYFYYVFLGSFIWYWFPGWIAQFLSIFAWVTWIAPNNIVVNQVFGGNTGLAFGALTFDWTQVTGYIFSPLISPFHAIANTGIAVVFWIWIVTPALHYTHHWYSDYLPISDSRSYNNMGTPYNVHKILTPEFTLDIKLYEAYSPLFLSTTFALLYGLSFAAIAAVIVHTILFNGKTILLRARQSREDMDDVHTKMMKKYPVTPDWWYLVLLVVMLGLSFATIYGWPTHLTWWALIIAFLIAGVWILPIGMIAATTNITLGLNVFTEYIIGYMLPGRPVAMMLFKTYGYITMTQGLTFVQDMKLGHYLKVPQRSMFWGQLVATIWSCLVQLAVVRWGLTNIRNVCTSLAPNGFNCPNGRVFFNASVIWGLIGPARIFSGDATYAGLQYFWIAGAIAPLFVYFGARMFPKSPIRYINMPIIFGGIGALPPATPLNYLSWVAVGTLFNKIIRNRYRGWWMRFNYITSAGLDTGLAICTIIIIACLTLTNATPRKSPLPLVRLVFSFMLIVPQLNGGATSELSTPQMPTMRPSR